MFKRMICIGSMLVFGCGLAVPPQNVQDFIDRNIELILTYEVDLDLLSDSLNKLPRLPEDNDALRVLLNNVKKQQHQVHHALVRGTSANMNNQSRMKNSTIPLAKLVESERVGANIEALDRFYLLEYQKQGITSKDFGNAVVRHIPSLYQAYTQTHSRYNAINMCGFYAMHNALSIYDIMQTSGAINQVSLINRVNNRGYFDVFYNAAKEFFTQTCTPQDMVAMNSGGMDGYHIESLMENKIQGIPFIVLPPFYNSGDHIVYSFNAIRDNLVAKLKDVKDYKIPGFLLFIFTYVGTSPHWIVTFITYDNKVNIMVLDSLGREHFDNFIIQQIISLS